MTAIAHPTLLTILYDANCSMCRRCKWWLTPRKKFVPLAFVAQGGPEAAKRYPTLRLGMDGAGRPDELVVVANDGRVWRGDGAWIMVLWALRDHRALAVRLAKNPVTRALARRAFAFLSHNREVINKFLPESRDDAMVRELKTPAGEAFEKRVMVCALPAKGGAKELKSGMAANDTVNALKEAYENAKGRGV